MYVCVRSRYGRNGYVRSNAPCARIFENVANSVTEATIEHTTKRAAFESGVYTSREAHKRTIGIEKRFSRPAHQKDPPLLRTNEVPHRRPSLFLKRFSCTYLKRSRHRNAEIAKSKKLKGQRSFSLYESSARTTCSG